MSTLHILPSPFHPFLSICLVSCQHHFPTQVLHQGICSLLHPGGKFELNRSFANDDHKRSFFLSRIAAAHALQFCQREVCSPVNGELWDKSKAFQYLNCGLSLSHEAKMAGACAWSLSDSFFSKQELFIHGHNEEWETNSNPETNSCVFDSAMMKHLPRIPDKIPSSDIALNFNSFHRLSLPHENSLCPFANSYARAHIKDARFGIDIISIRRIFKIMKLYPRFVERMFSSFSRHVNGDSLKVSELWGIREGIIKILGVNRAFDLNDLSFLHAPHFFLSLPSELLFSKGPLSTVSSHSTFDAFTQIGFGIAKIEGSEASFVTAQKFYPILRWWTWIDSRQKKNCARNLSSSEMNDNNDQRYLAVLCMMHRKA